MSESKHTLSGVKAGDTLFVVSRFSKHLVKVERVTPTGRVITKNGEYNPNGRLRGAAGWDSPRARLATEDDIAGINRGNLVYKLERFQWGNLDAETLKKVCELIADKGGEKTL